jgi:hypothetical protein
MGLLRRHHTAPLVVGSAVCVVDTAGHGWVGQQCHADLAPDHIALLAATTFMLQGARVRAVRRLPVAPWLEATRTAASDPETFNETMNSSGVGPLGLEPPPGVRMRGSLSLLPTGSLTGDWEPVDCFAHIALASRLFGVLAAAALWCEIEAALEHAARMLEESADEVDFTRPTIMPRMPQTLIAFGIRQAALGRTPPARPREDEPGEPAPY